MSEELSTTVETVPTEQSAERQHTFGDVSALTEKTIRELVSNRFYPEILSALADGDASVELRKRVMLRALDEAWVNAIEETLPMIDAIIRTPGRFIEEREVVLPIGQSKAITARSIRHLSQHVDYISEIDADGSVTPSKILNVFRDETIFTYENKFVNTLLDRMASFVSLRYREAKKNPQDTRSTTLTFNNTFVQGELHGKIHFSVEVEEPAGENVSGKTHVYTSDLWRRVEHLNEVCMDYVTSPFCKEMGQNYVHPPIVHTNALMKNKNLKKCLALWEYLESYRNIGYTMLVEEHLENVDEDYIRDLYETLSVQYMQFCEKIHGEFDEDETLDTHKSAEFAPQIVETIVPTTADEFDAHYGVKKPESVSGRELTDLDHRILRAVDVCIQADALWLKAAKLAELRANSLRRSYISRIIQAAADVQTAYSAVKNALLCYAGAKSRISWDGENFTKGRVKLATLSMRGKTLALSLALNPADFENTKYHFNDMSAQAKFRDVPMLVKLRSERGVKHALELIEKMAEKLGLIKTEWLTVDYGMPYRTDAQLIKEGLIKAQGNYTVEEEKEPEWPNVFEDVSERIASQDLFDPTERHLRCYESRLIQSDDAVKEYYSLLKNTLLSYKTVKCRMSRSGETFKSGRDKLAQIRFKGKTLVVLMALDPTKFSESKYHHKDVFASTPELPLMMKLRSARSAKYADELAQTMLQQRELVFTGEKNVNYAMPYENDDALINRGLIKVIVTPSGMDTLREENRFKKGYAYSFGAALVMASPKTAEWYSRIKNCLLSGVGVRSEMDKAGETYYKGRNEMARLSMLGGVLNVTLYNPLENEEKTDDVRESTTYYIVSETAARQTMTTVTESFFTTYGLAQNPHYESCDFCPEDRTEEQLIAEGEIVPGEEPEEILEEPTVAEEAVAEEPALEPTEDAVETIPTEYVPKEYVHNADLDPAFAGRNISVDEELDEFKKNMKPSPMYAYEVDKPPFMDMEDYKKEESLKEEQRLRAEAEKKATEEHNGSVLNKLRNLFGGRKK